MGMKGICSTISRFPVWRSEYGLVASGLLTFSKPISWFLRAVSLILCLQSERIVVFVL